jgi:hypothetical protein
VVFAGLTVVIALAGLSVVGVPTLTKARKHSPGGSRPGAGGKIVETNTRLFGFLGLTATVGWPSLVATRLVTSIS